VTHRPAAGSGGAVARWRSLLPYLERAGWEVDVVSADEVVPEFEAHAASPRRGREAVRRVVAPVLRIGGVRPAALTPATLWARQGARAVRASLANRPADVVLATAPPIAGPLAARLGIVGDIPLVVELRDLWAASPAYDAGGRLLPAVERWLLRRAAAIVVVTPEAAADIARRHPTLASRVVTIPNGFEPELLELRHASATPGRPIDLLHSGTLIASRPLTPLLRALGRQPHGAFRLVLQGYLAPESLRELDGLPPGVAVEVLPPASWRDAVARMAAADACVILQSRAAGDATAVAAKAYEYLALGRPILCLTHGGATAALLERLGAGSLVANLDDDRAIDAALTRLASGDVPAPVPPERLAPYRRDELARKLAEVLTAVAQRSFVA
jgi:glycosyltransferase involved in cell wall biosynthesis